MNRPTDPPPDSPVPGTSDGRAGGGERSEPTGIPVLDTASALGPVAETYEEEFQKLKHHLLRTKNVLGPVAPLVFVTHARKLYAQANAIVGNASLSPHDKCVCLFQLFDAIVLAYKNIAFVYCDANRGARSVYGYSEMVLKNLLSRVEAMARRVAVAVHDAYSLTALNEVVASAEQRLSQVRSEKDMFDFFRGLSGSVSDVLPPPPPMDSITATALADTSIRSQKLPFGVERYRDPYPEVDRLLRLLYTSCGPHRDYVREFHDAVLLIATANAPTDLTGALETRFTDKDRNVVWLQVPGDRLFASSMCASAIAFLRKSLNHTTSTTTTAVANRATRADAIETYTIDYGRVFSKYRGESERNFDTMMEWIKNSVRGADDKFRVFWFPDIENLMSPRTSNDQEHIATIKNSMLQHMDVFNKDRTLRSFLLLFNSSEGPLDSAFARRLETVVSAPSAPLADLSVAAQVVTAELARYHINLSDDLLARIAAGSGSPRGERSSSAPGRIGGFAYVQATLRDLYVEQKLILRHDAGMVATEKLAPETLQTLMGRYIPIAGSPPVGDTLYDLNERPIAFADVGAVAFGLVSRLAIMFSRVGFTRIKHNSDTVGDPKSIDDRVATRTVFLHDIVHTDEATTNA